MVTIIKNKKIIIVTLIIILTSIFSTVVLSKKFFNNNIEILERNTIIKKIKQSACYDNNPIIIHELEYHKTNKKNEFEDHFDIQLFITEQQEKLLPVIENDTNEQEITLAHHVSTNNLIQESNIDLNLCSFVTMPIPDNYTIDIETQHSLNSLIGNDFNQFIKLIMQSNNNVVSQQACRSCVFYTFFKKIKKHKKLTTDEIKTLQHIIGNLYRFIESMNNISSVAMLTPEQYNALQDLNRPQHLKNSMKLQIRKTTAAKTLKKLQSTTNKR